MLSARRRAMSFGDFFAGAVRIAHISTATILAAQIAVIAARVPRCVNRAEPIFLCLFSLALGVRVFFAGISPLLLVLDSAILWSAGAFLAEIAGSPKRVPWALANASSLAVLLFAVALGYGRTHPFTAFQAFGTCLLAAYPLALLAKEGRRTRSAPLLAGFSFAILWLAAAGADAARSAFGCRPIGGSGLAVLLLVGCSAWLVCAEGYPFPSGWRGRRQSADNKEKLLRDAWARLLETEGALALQDGMIASGLLALGAAHEFKNVLSHIRAVAQHALGLEDAKRKNESLLLLLEQAESSQESAVELLERLSRQGREIPRVMDAARDLSHFLRLARASCRGEGFLLTVDIAAEVRFLARRNEVEQALLNLLRNAMEGYRRRGSVEGSVIWLSAFTLEAHAVIEVEDRAGGVASDIAHRLFSLASSGTESTGIGLFLARGLVSRNGGTLEHLPVDGGSRFRLVFPAAAGSPTGRT
jgi:signal transduction histidine kinase